MEQTAMQMAINHYKKLSEQGSNQAYVVAKFLEENFLEMEKQQIVDSFEKGYENGAGVSDEDPIYHGGNYYNKTFKSE